MLKIILAGTPAIAVPAFTALIDHPEFDVSAIFTQPDQPVGRRQVLTPPPVKELARARQIPVYQWEKLRNNPEVEKLCTAMAPDIMVVFAYGQILPDSLLTAPRLGCINIHASLLPKYRGASPIQEALLQGDTDTGLTYIRLVTAMDAGDILTAYPLPIAPTDTTASVSDKLAQLAAETVAPTLLNYQLGKIALTPQDPALATHCRKITKELGEINFTQLTATEIDRRRRAFTPWPGIFTFTATGHRLKILDGYAIPTPPAHTFAWPTKDGYYVPTIVQPESKNAMPISDYLRGHPIIHS